MGMTDVVAARGSRYRPLGSAPLAIEATGLAKRFGGTQALAGVDLAVAAGTVYGPLGPNGAGETTTARLLATLLAPDGGTARGLGLGVAAHAGALGRRCPLRA